METTSLDMGIKQGAYYRSDSEDAVDAFCFDCEDSIMSGYSYWEDIPDNKKELGERKMNGTEDFRKETWGFCEISGKRYRVTVCDARTGEKQSCSGFKPGVRENCYYCRSFNDNFIECRRPVK